MSLRLGADPVYRPADSEIAQTKRRAALPMFGEAFPQ